MYEYSGAVHIHSVYSDGTGKIEDIARAAADSGLDFIMMTDHNTLKPGDDGYARWINNVMVIIGYEVNDMNNKNHYLAFGLNEVIGTYQELGNGELGCKLPAKEYVSRINEKGGIGFIAHPDEERNHYPQHPSYPWTDDADGYTGIEIWNHMSEWVEGMNENNKLERLIHPLKSIVSPSAKTLKRWDSAALKRHVTAIGGVDAHAFKQSIMGIFELEIFPYKVLFKSIRTHVIVDSPILPKHKNNYEEDKNKVLNALKTGRCFIANHYYGNANGFRYFAEYKGNSYTSGDTISITDGNALLKVFAPKPCTIRLIQNGEKIRELEGMEAAWDINSAGIYRIECWINDRGWIFSNHIRINNEK
jgi:hypothetical protein